MIKINGEEIELKHFPDGTFLFNETNLKLPENHPYMPINIKWQYESEDECIAIWYIKKHLQKVYGKDKHIHLLMYYIPNARMDRVKSPYEIFTLKYFAEFINYLDFYKVFVVDPHSYVSEALFNNLNVADPKYYIEQVLKKLSKEYEIDPSDVVLYFPDDGAMKRYSSLFPNNHCIYGKKLRDWNTGEIKGLEIENGNVSSINNPLLMIDDIISYGGTLYYSAEKLLDLNPNLNIYAYITHTEKSVEQGKFAKLLDSNKVKQLFTTDSIYSGSYNNITIL